MASGWAGKTQPAQQAQEFNIPWPLFPGDITGLERDQKAGGTQKPAGTSGPGAHLLVSTKGTSLSQESFITSNSTSILRQMQFCSHISDPRFWVTVQSFLSIWFPPRPRHPPLCLPKHLTKLSLSSYRKEWSPSPGRTFDYSSNSLSWEIKDHFFELNQFVLWAIFS